MSFQTVLDYWFNTLTPKEWFSHNADVDAYISEHFTDMHTAASTGELAAWRTAPKGRLAEILLLDQFSRHIYRDTPKAFAQDELATRLTLEAIETDGVEEALSEQELQFLYMPLMHSESAAVHELAVQKFEDLGNEEALKYEHLHKRIIDRFGRYPHRNEILGRDTTAEEAQFLAEDDNASF